MYKPMQASFEGGKLLCRIGDEVVSSVDLDIPPEKQQAVLDFLVKTCVSAIANNQKLSPASGGRATRIRGKGASTFGAVSLLSEATGLKLLKDVF